MKFDDLDKKMRVYETAHDHCVLPGLHIVARLDGRNFTRLTKEIESYEAPFDERFRDHMVGTVHHVMQCGFKVVYGYTESDEISLLLDVNEQSFGRKLRKINSVLAGEASGFFSLAIGRVAVFDCRTSLLPTERDVVDYFRWRNEDAHRNALNAHCYWQRRGEGDSAKDATKAFLGRSVAEKNEYLFTRGVNFNDVPAWQKRGVGVYWHDVDVVGTNPVTGDQHETTRRRLQTCYDLPMRDEYDAFIRDRLHTAD